VWKPIATFTGRSDDGLVVPLVVFSEHLPGGPTGRLRVETADGRRVSKAGSGVFSSPAGRVSTDDPLARVIAPSD
jgi:hypothetical protein